MGIKGNDFVIEDDSMFLCPVRANPKWNFVRRFCCSLPIGHSGAHRAYWNNNTQGEIAWVGPWEDDSYYIVCEDMGIEEWINPTTSSSKESLDQKLTA